MANLLSMFKSRLLLPVFIVLISVAVLQILINSWLTHSRVQLLSDQIHAELDQSAETVTEELSNSEKAVQERLESMRREASSLLAAI